MPKMRTYDEPDVLHKLAADGESVAEFLTVLGKEAYDRALSEGWRDPSEPNTALPKLPFPTTLYMKNGATKIVHNRAEKAAAMEEGWETNRYPAPVVYDVAGVNPGAEPGSPAWHAAQAANNAAAGQSVELALKLIESNERQAAQAKEIDELKAQNAEIIELLKAQAPKGKQKPEAH